MSSKKMPHIVGLTRAPGRSAWIVNFAPDWASTNARQVIAQKAVASAIFDLGFFMFYPQADDNKTAKLAVDTDSDGLSLATFLGR